MTYSAAIDRDLAKGYFFHGALAVRAFHVGKFIQLSVGGKFFWLRHISLLFVGHNREF